MPSANPFPGMDPYLEHAALWPGVHSGLINEIRKQIAPKLRPRYAVSVEERVFLERPSDARMPDVWIQEIPREPSFPWEPSGGGVALAAEATVAEPLVISMADLEIHETYLEILDLYQNQQVVTVIEVISPTNKSSSVGRDAYKTKQSTTLASTTHLVEIDLLRQGTWALAVAQHAITSRAAAEYYVAVSRAVAPRQAEVYPCRLQQRLPRFRIPLAAPDPDVVLDLQAALDQVHDDGSYALRLRNDQPCDPSLPPADQEWANGCVTQFKAAHLEWYQQPTPSGGAEAPASR